MKHTYTHRQTHTAISASALQPVQSLFLGGRHDNQSNWEGRLDEAAIFDRALSAAEVKALSTP